MPMQSFSCDQECAFEADVKAVSAVLWFLAYSNLINMLSMGFLQIKLEWNTLGEGTSCTPTTVYEKQSQKERNKNRNKHTNKSLNVCCVGLKFSSPTAALQSSLAALFAHVNIAVVSTDHCWGCTRQQKCVSLSRSCGILQLRVMMF